jgi:hypothetical protein
MFGGGVGVNRGRRGRDPGRKRNDHFGNSGAESDGKDKAQGGRLEGVIRGDRDVDAGTAVRFGSFFMGASDLRSARLLALAVVGPLQIRFARIFAADRNARERALHGENCRHYDEQEGTYGSPGHAG